MDDTARSLPAPLRLWLDAPRAAGADGATSFVLRVRNDGEAPLELTLRGRTITFDIVVKDASGRVVWRKLDGAAIPAIARLLTLAPGAQLALRTRWDQRDRAGTTIAAGAYTVHGALLTDADAPLETESVPFTVRAP